MKYLKLISLTLLFTIGFIFPSCVNCDCSDVPDYFDVTGLELESYADFGRGEQIAVNDTISFSDLDGIALTLEVEYVAVQLKRDWSFSLMNTAMACSCAVGGKGAKTERIENISITTLNDFDDEHLANSDVTELFEVDRFKNFLIANPITIAEFLQQEKDSEENLMDERFIFKLKKAPTINATLSIKLTLELSNGETYEVENLPYAIVE